jgi:hypothetical protein
MNLSKYDLSLEKGTQMLLFLLNIFLYIDPESVATWFYIVYADYKLKNTIN